jgi:hypothetical protein
MLVFLLTQAVEETDNEITGPSDEIEDEGPN